MFEINSFGMDLTEGRQQTEVSVNLNSGQYNL